MKFAIIVFPGSNCDRDCYYFISNILKQEAVYVWHKEAKLPQVDCVILPGGFSYGDYLRCGAIARFSPIMKEVAQFAGQGGKVIGICNGFQILTECHLLPGALLRNRDLHFICKTVYLKIENNFSAFTKHYKPGSIIKMPIAHGDGNYFIDSDGVKSLQDHQQIVLRYSNAAGEVSEEFNPNGSLENIAGICNRQGNVFGLMPHPERVGEASIGGEDGKKLFEGFLKQ